MKALSFFVLFSLSTLSLAQNKMKSVEELIIPELIWKFPDQWIYSPKNKVEILPCDSVKAKEALFHTQVTTHSPIGAVVYTTGGILIDNGWIRILGSGHQRLNRTLPDWNKGKSFAEFGERPTFSLIADDAVGGLFAINGGKFGEDEKERGIVYYLAPETLVWESLHVGYYDFLDICFNGNLMLFYKNFRWINWEKDVSTLDGNKVYTFYPYLFTKEADNIDAISKKVIPMDEQYLFLMDMRKQLGLEE